MICRNCGTEIADKALICYRCGTATTEAKFKPAVTRSSRRSPISIILLSALLGVIVYSVVVVTLARFVDKDAANYFALAAAIIAASAGGAYLRRGRRL